MILTCYDGSDDARAAIERAGALFRGHQAVVLTIWETFGGLIARTPAMASAIGVTDFERIDNASRQSAQETAEQGAEAARGAGLDATAVARAQLGSVAHTILEQAEESGVDAVVLGSRGLGGVESFLLGSVSRAVLQSADRPVVVIPSPDVALERTRKRHER